MRVVLIIVLPIAHTFSSDNPEECSSGLPGCCSLRLSELSVIPSLVGFWVGNVSMLNAAERTFFEWPSSQWNYSPRDYRLFIHAWISEDGRTYEEDGVYLYPPQNEEKCSASGYETQGTGVCGVNGNEKIYTNNPMVLSSCQGTLSHNFVRGNMTVTVELEIVDDTTAVETASIAPMSMTTKATTRVSSTEKAALIFKTGDSDIAGDPYIAFYERFVNLGKGEAAEQQWLTQLAAQRSEYNILASDFCGHDSSGAASEESCSDHFGFEMP